MSYLSEKLLIGVGPAMRSQFKNQLLRQRNTNYSLPLRKKEKKSLKKIVLPSLLDMGGRSNHFL